MPFIESLEKLTRKIEKEKQANKKIITTNGCFDIVHVGHIRYLQQAKEMGDILVVGINSDASVKEIKGKGRPVNNQKDRAEILSALRSVDYTYVFKEPDPILFLSKIKPHVHVKGGDYKMDQIIEREVVEANRGKVVLVPMIKGQSTTRILRRIRQNSNP